ncbi:adenosine 3'-phospho 5'-phosphosulfate transporter 2 isoform X5 [Lynx canadensis]|nr:adenosine 3'-phospho 5'-phosphosulfate transporter 2 isoform X5 [Lynx canadensis]XP_046957644.1 adenosine 3'-phospho 5'-phosphosulfate transporter 2 isoform X5 [Lynx rufus]
MEGFKSFGWYLTLVQFAFYSIFGLIELQLIQDKRRRIPGKTYMIIAFLTVGTMGLSNTSLGYLNYPTQVIFKCCKLIPVMLGGVFIQGKRYNIADVSAAICMSLGLIWFTLADSTVAPNFNLTGVILISLALCADAVIGNVQEKAMKLHNASNSEMVLYSYSIGFVYILLGLTCTSGLGPAVTFCSKNPIQTYGYAFLFSLTGYFGISFVLALIKIFGALLAVTVTTGRKAMTIVLSFMFFSKPFTFHNVPLFSIIVQQQNNSRRIWPTHVDHSIQSYVQDLYVCVYPEMTHKEDGNEEATKVDKKWPNLFLEIWE